LRHTLAEPDREDKEHNQHRGNYVNNWRLIGSKEIIKDPLRQRFSAWSSSKCGDHDFIKGECEGEKASGDKR